jgi:hypothetical protein
MELGEIVYEGAEVIEQDQTEISSMLNIILG